jgi:hypothetical protein
MIKGKDRTHVRMIMEQRAPSARSLRLASQPSPTHIGENFFFFCFFLLFFDTIEE